MNRRLSPAPPRTRSALLFAAIALALLWGGCATAPQRGGYTPTGDPVADGRSLRALAPPKDQLLWQYRVGLAAMRAGRWADARTEFDTAIARLQTVFGPDAEARKARGKFRAESRKQFIGEPFERVMAYFYRGILYWMDGEPDNARACFRNGQFIDSDAENKSYAGDYALLDYLDGLVTCKLGGDGSDAWSRAKTNAHLAKPAPYYTNWNVLFFVEAGKGPGKYATGEFGEELRFRPGAGAVKRVRLTASGQTAYAEMWDDLTFQATTRGGREMDHILANKAVFKRGTDAAGTVAIVGGAIMATQQGRHSSVDEVGAGLIVAGVLSKIFSAATVPAADTRAWETLPNLIGFGATYLPPGEHQLTVEFLDAHNTPIAGATRTLTLQVLPSPRDTVVFLSELAKPPSS